MDTVPPAGVVQDSPAFPAVGHPAFGNFGGGLSFLAPAAGLRRALDAAVNEHQQGSQDFIAACRHDARLLHRRVPRLALLVAALPQRQANSGDLCRDATAPGAPANVRLDGKTLRFTSPGDDLLCGRPAAYEVSVEGKPFTRASAQPVDAGQPVSIALTGGRPKTVTVRGMDDQDNLGRPVTAGR